MDHHAAATAWLVTFGAVSLWLVEASYLPQIWKLFRMKEADEFSYLFPSLNILGRLGGLAVSIAQGSFVFGIFFVVGILLRATLMYQVFYYRALKRKRAGQVNSSADVSDLQDLHGGVRAHAEQAPGEVPVPARA